MQNNLKIELFIETAIIILFSIGVLITFYELANLIDNIEYKDPKERRINSAELYPTLRWMIIVLLSNIISTLSKALLNDFSK